MGLFLRGCSVLNGLMLTTVFCVDLDVCGVVEYGGGLLAGVLVLPALDCLH